MSIRKVPIDEAQIDRFKRMGVQAMQNGRHDDGKALLDLVLSWTLCPVERFKCDVDESAGLAEITGDGTGQALPPLVEGFSPPRTWNPSGDTGASSAASKSDDAAGAEIHDLHGFSKKVGA